VALTPDTDQFSQFLRLAFLRSPNYVTGVSGWTINQDGSAEFNNLTIRGTFKGTNFEINSNGAFFYSGPPAAGNLIASIANTAGTDSHTNAYLAGLTVYGSSGGQRIAIQLFDIQIVFATAPTAAGPFTRVASAALSVVGSLDQLNLQAFSQFGAVLVINGEVYVQPSGDATGVTDLANINNALAVGPVHLAPGLYTINAAITMPASTSLCGPPSVPDKVTGTSRARIKLVSGSNSHMIQVNGADCTITDLELDGNKTGQTSGFGNGVLISGQNTAILRNLSVHDQRFRGINITNSQAHLIADCWCWANGDAGIFIDTNVSDVTIRGGYCGSNAGSGIYCAGYVIFLSEVGCYSNTLHGIQMDWPGFGRTISACGVDRNQQHGILITGSSVTVQGCTLHSNGQAANNTYSSITVDNTVNATNGVAVEGCNFWLDALIVNLVAWHIQYKNTATAKTHGNGFSAGSSATGTISGASAAKDVNETG
jgi:Right handed beta helix region